MRSEAQERSQGAWYAFERQALFHALDPFGCYEVNGPRRAREKREGIWEAVSVVPEREDHTWMMAVELLRTDQIRGSAQTSS